jgi:hypothetical protein
LPDKYRKKFVVSRVIIRGFRGQKFVVSRAIIRGFRGKHKGFFDISGVNHYLKGCSWFQGLFHLGFDGVLTIYDFVVSGANLRGFRGRCFVVSGVKSSWFQGLQDKFYTV